MEVAREPLIQNEPDEIVIKLSEQISCPFDATHRFPLRQGLQESTIHQLLDRFARQRAELRIELEAALRHELEAHAKVREKELTEQNELLQQRLGDFREQLAQA